MTPERLSDGQKAALLSILFTAIMVYGCTRQDMQIDFSERRAAMNDARDTQLAAICDDVKRLDGRPVGDFDIALTHTAAHPALQALYDGACDWRYWSLPPAARQARK